MWYGKHKPRGLTLDLDDEEMSAGLTAHPSAISLATACKGAWQRRTADSPGISFRWALADRRSSSTSAARHGRAGPHGAILTSSAR